MDSITFLSGPRNGETLNLADTQVLGRSGRADIRIDDASVSREHARFSRTEQGWTLIDLGSSNGSSIDGVRVPRGVVQSGSVITLGVVHMKLHCGTRIAATPAASAGTDEVQAVGRSAGAAVIRTKAAREQSSKRNRDSFGQLDGSRKALMVALLILLCAALFYGAYSLV